MLEKKNKKKKFQIVVTEKIRTSIKCEEPGLMCADCAAVINCIKDGDNWDWNIVDVCRLHEGFTCQHGKCSIESNPDCSRIKN